MKKLILFTALFLISINQLKAQGCVAIRSTGSNLCTLQHPEGGSTYKGWQLNMGYRYFKSFRHFVGTEEQKQRLEQHTEVINHQHTLDLSVVRYFSNRLSLVVGLPIVGNSRSARSHYGNRDRYLTHSFGIGDMRITAYYWIMDPTKKTRKGNIQLGLGLKLPTGDYKYQDYFPSSDSTWELRTVDQSIQPGDGGTGIITEMNAFYNFSPLAGVFANAFYLINPREVNGVPTFRSRPTEAIMSVPDQWMLRAGFNYGFIGKLKHFSLALGGRMECLPVHDLVGGSEGFRRPGYIISAEPGVNYTTKKINYYLEVPVALVRSRTQSVPDKETTVQTGVYKQGDAAFADYVINIGCSITL